MCKSFCSLSKKDYLGYIQFMNARIYNGCLSSVITVCICFRLSLQNAALMLTLIVLSAFVSALTGLFIGRISDGLMAGVVYIKIVMLLFMAAPILSFLLEINQPLPAAICYAVPSQATFEGIMALSAGNGTEAVKDIFILLGHSIGGLLFYIGLSVRRRKHT